MLYKLKKIYSQPECKMEGKVSNLMNATEKLSLEELECINGGGAGPEKLFSTIWDRGGIAGGLPVGCQWGDCGGGWI